MYVGCTTVLPLLCTKEAASLSGIWGCPWWVAMVTKKKKKGKKKAFQMLRQLQKCPKSCLHLRWLPHLDVLIKNYYFYSVRLGLILVFYLESFWHIWIARPMWKSWDKLCIALHCPAKLFIVKGYLRDKFFLDCCYQPTGGCYWKPLNPSLIFMGLLNSSTIKPKSVIKPRQTYLPEKSHPGEGRER